MRERLSAAGWGYAFIGPALILVAVFLVFPIMFMLYISLHKWGLLGAPTFVGFDNFGFLAADSRFWRSLANTLFYMVLSVPSQIGLGLFLAILVNQKVRGREAFRTAFFIPLAISFVAAGILFTWMFSTTPIEGFFPKLLSSIGLEFPRWQTSEGGWAMVMIAVMNTWKSAGYCMIVYLAGLQGINKEWLEAAAIDGVRTQWQEFRHITWPLLAPTTFLLVVTTTIFTVRGFEPIFVMTQGGPAGGTTTLVYYLYSKFPDTVGIASAAGTVLLVGVLALTLVQFLANQRRATYY
jgi:ABC-type sugar transport system permease subunit